MSRSRTLATACVALAALLAAAPTASFGAKKRNAKLEELPNIVMVVTDDQTLEMLNRRTMPETITRIGGEGTTFTNAIATTPLCCPSRASILTGQYGHNNGVLDNKYRLLLKRGQVLPQWLRKARYTTIHVGRYLNGYERVPKARTEPAPGWDQWHSLIKPRRYYGYTLSVNGGTRPYTNAPEDYLTTVLTERAVKMINRFGPQSKPFYLQFDQFAPHTSGGAENGGRCTGAAIPGPQDERAFENTPLPRTPNFNEEDIDDKPSFIRDQSKLDAEQLENVERRYRCALASLREVDRSVAAVDDALKAVGERKRTVFVFLSDNGFYYGEHRLPGSKSYPYAEAYRLPLLMRVPRKYVKAEPPSQVDTPVANIDLAPTILSFADGKPCMKSRNRRCRTMDGRSLIPLLRGREGNYPEDRAFAVELSRGRGAPVEGDGSGACSYQGIYTGANIYVEYGSVYDPSLGTCTAIDEKELYDLTADPYQLTNQATQTSSLLQPSPLQNELAERLASLRICAGIGGRDRHQDGRPFCE